MSSAHPGWFDELAEWLEIPSISADPERAEDVQAAGEWLCAFIRAAGGSAKLLDWNGQPLAIGKLEASTDPSSAPTVLVYGHFDVQPPGPVSEWQTGPFEPTILGEWLYGRGVADDKGGLYLLAKGAAELAHEQALPVNVCFACDGEEESGGNSIVEFLAAHPPEVDVCLIFDALMLERERPALTIAMRGTVYCHLTLRAGDRDPHSGLVGGAGANALNELVRALAALLPVRGRLPEPLRTGIITPSRQELADWAVLPSGEEALSELGARAADDDAADEFYRRVWAEPAFDVHGIAGGEPHMVKTIAPMLADANFSVRLAPGQSPARIATAIEQLLREALPKTVEVQLDVLSCTPPTQLSAESPAIQLALDAFEEGFGRRPVLIRSGGSLPVVAVLQQLGVPTIATGFALPESNLHAANERMLVDHFPAGIATARALYTRLRRLERLDDEEGIEGHPLSGP